MSTMEQYFLNAESVGMNSTVLGWHVQDFDNIKPDKIPAWNREVDMTPTLASELVTVYNHWESQHSVKL